jgi:hypothetical protein
MSASPSIVWGFPPIATHNCLSLLDALVTTAERVFVSNPIAVTIPAPTPKGFFRAPPSSMVYHKKFMNTLKCQYKKWNETRGLKRFKSEITLLA